MFGDHGLCGLLEEGAHGKSPKCLGGNLGGFWGDFAKVSFSMFAKVSAGLDGSAVFCRNGAVKRIFMSCQYKQRPSEIFQTALCGNRDAWSGTGFALSMACKSYR